MTDIKGVELVDGVELASSLEEDGVVGDDSSEV